ncbi:hypothetical protein NX821_000379 [Clostridium septicum]|uniref:hypothetical protein n=1 Tax=Clostridium septicum TaxID=1504 RepID=UPI00272E1E76|nr:hypothetical protein [Clostridium septicum]WLF69802.1 hypothetical protein Q6375_01935 [Clostridium septicum]
MRYLILSIILIFIVFIATFMFTLVVNKNNSLRGNIKLSFMMLVVSLPIMSLIGGCLFLAFKLITVVLSLNITTIQVFIIALIGVIIIFVCDLISKQIIAEISSKIFAKKYENQELTEYQMMEIINKSKGIFNTFELIIMFLFSGILYLGAMKLISIEVNLLFLFIISIVNIVSYKLFFRHKVTTDN